MKYYLLSLLFFASLFMVPVHADVIGNPLIWMLYDPIGIILLIIAVCLISGLIKKILRK